MEEIKTIKLTNIRTSFKTIQKAISLAIHVLGKPAFLFLGLELLRSIIPPIQFWVTKKIIDTVISSLSLPLNEAIRSPLPFLILA